MNFGAKVFHESSVHENVEADTRILASSLEQVPRRSHAIDSSQKTHVLNVALKQANSYRTVIILQF
jgi:hypothetical protein